jgi:hypothetical protein
MSRSRSTRSTGCAQCDVPGLQYERGINQFFPAISFRRAGHGHRRVPNAEVASPEFACAGREAQLCRAIRPLRALGRSHRRPVPAAARTVGPRGPRGQVPGIGQAAKRPLNFPISY